MLADAPQKIRVKPVSNRRLIDRDLEAYPLEDWVLNWHAMKKEKQTIFYKKALKYGDCAYDAV